MKLFEIKSFRKDTGHCWIAPLPAGVAPGDSVDRPASTRLRLFESGVELGPGRAAHAWVREKGRGAFSHWGEDLFFSTSDNSPPGRNGRKYFVVAPAVGETADPSEAAGASGVAVPVNYGLLEATPQQAREAAEYAIRVAESYTAALPGGRNAITGKSVLELGPGTSFATTLTLACWGAKRIGVADRFLAPFRAAYHVPIYRNLIELLRAQDPRCDVQPIERCIAEEGHPPQVITALNLSLEMFEANSRETYDIVLSNAVFEHLFNPLRALRGLWSITAPGGIGLHQVDFRDHRSFERPLEYLLMDEFSFVELLQQVHGECGNRLRPHQMEGLFRKAGFSSIQFTPNMSASEEYLADFVPRLRDCPESPYHQTSIEQLRVVSGQYRLAK
jgi:SAM-dependent methyltransferase